VKHLKTYESVNPDRISDGTFRIYSDKLELTKGGRIDKSNQNLFYVSNISWGIDDSWNSNMYEIGELDTWFDYHEDDEYPMGAQVCIDFYSSRLTLFSNKILKITFTVNECGNIESFYGEVGDKVVDVTFSRESFNDLIEFIKDDSPNHYNIIDNIDFWELEQTRKNLLRRI